MSIEDKYYFDEEAANDVVEFIEGYIIHWEGRFAGEPFKLEPWQRKLVRDLFGWKVKATGLRKYKIAYIEIPRKNGKSSLIAAVGLYLLFCDGEQGAQVYSAAADRSQAAIVFEMAKRYVESEELLTNLSNIYRNSIVYPEAASKYQVLSADAPTKHGLNPHAVLFDELHTQKNRALWDVLETAVGTRAQPLILAITTAGFDTDSICYQLHEYARQILDGTIEDETFYACIFAADEGDDWTHRDTWAKANPNLGVTVSEEFLQQQCEKAKKLPEFENTFKQLYLNIWTEQQVRWISKEAWAECFVEFDESDLLGRACTCGVDLSSTTDITALSLVFPMDDDRYRTINFHWLPEARITSKFEDGVNYQGWVNNGYINKCEGAVIDYRQLLAFFDVLMEKFNILQVAIDRWNATQFAQELEAKGLEVVLMGQGFASMSPASKEFENSLLSQKLEHDNNPVINWQIGNVAIDKDPAGNIKPSKKRSKKRIDGVVAMIMALYRAKMLGDQEADFTIY